MKYLTEFTEGTKNARIYYLENQDKIAGKGKYMVLFFESDSDYNEARFFNNEDDANDYGEDWVMRT